MNNEIRFFRKGKIKQFCQTKKKESLQTASMKHSNSSDKKTRTKYIFKEMYKGSSSEEEHMENALALVADEGRDKLRKASGSCI